MDLSILFDLFEKVKKHQSHLVPGLVLGGFALGFLSLTIGVYTLLFTNKASVAKVSQEVFHPVSQVQASTESTSLMVDISGAVKNPGIYSFSQGQRVSDMIQKAGGFQDKVDKGYIAKNLNLSAKLKDEEKLYIPFQGEQGLFVSSSKSSSLSSNTSANTSALVNINSASQSELMDLEGIGEVRASKIISNRPYSTLDELLEKDVVTQKIFENIKKDISI